MNWKSALDKKLIIFSVFMAAISTVSCGLKAKEEKKEEQVAGNEYKIFLLNDVTRKSSADILLSPDPDTLKKYIPDGTYTSVVNAFLVQRNDSNFLFDTGTGSAQLIKNLAAHGVMPENVHKIFITHCHGDHIGGLLKDEQAVFPNAEIYMNKIEYDYWLKEQNPLFLNVIEKYKNQLQVFDINGIYTMISDICAYAAYGHTPGHTMFLFGKHGNETLLWGDITHVMPVQMPHPQYSVSFDVNPVQAAETRQKVLKMAASENMTVAGMHVPTMGTVTENGAGGYVFNPIKE